MRQISEDFVNFITSHENDDPASLLLSREKWKGIDIELAINTISTRKRLKTKVPSWYAIPELIYPSKLSGEQCSSEETAAIKADIAKKILENSKSISPETPADRKDIQRKGFRVADLTGGMGIDSLAFSKIADRVLYNEMNTTLAEAAIHNFKTLMADNIIVSSKIIESSEKTHHLKNNTGTELLDGNTISPADLLGEFRPDMIFLDPARRNQEGKKVFLIEDCSPDILTIKDELLSISRFVMIKLSPMADIDMVTDRLGENCREIHITGAGGECKELLAILDREWKGECRICAGDMTFLRSEEKDAKAQLPESTEEIENARFLFEPDKTLLKSGAFNLISTRLGLTKLAKSTHLYISRHSEINETCMSCGKVFKIIEVSRLDKASIRRTGKTYIQAEVTARNIPMNSDLFRKKLGVSSGGSVHIFGAGVEYGRKKEPFLFVTERIP